MSLNDKLLEQAREADNLADHSKDGSSGPTLVLEGKTPARLIGYIELGLQPQEYQGKETKPATEVQLVFECYGKNMYDTEVQGDDGSTTTKKVGKIFRPFSMKLSTSPKAGFRKMFKNMDYGRGVKHMSHMLNEVFLLDIEHKKTGSGYEYASIKSISKPIIEVVNPETGEFGEPINIATKQPPTTRNFQLFLVEEPSIEQWDSIFIDGEFERTVKNDDGTEVKETVSKNFIQETITKALDWEGSAMQAILLDLEASDGAEEPEEPAKETKKESASKAATDAAEAALAELGM